MDMEQTNETLLSPTSNTGIVDSLIIGVVNRRMDAYLDTIRAMLHKNEDYALKKTIDEFMDEAEERLVKAVEKRILDELDDLIYNQVRNMTFTVTVD
jgi:hypothetical protein